MYKNMIIWGYQPQANKSFGLPVRGWALSSSATLCQCRSLSPAWTEAWFLPFIAAVQYLTRSRIIAVCWDTFQPLKKWVIYGEMLLVADFIAIIHWHIQDQENAAQRF